MKRFVHTLLFGLVLLLGYCWYLEGGVCASGQDEFAATLCFDAQGSHESDNQVTNEGDAQAANESDASSASDDGVSAPQQEQSHHDGKLQESLPLTRLAGQEQASRVRTSRGRHRVGADLDTLMSVGFLFALWGAMGIASSITHGQRCESSPFQTSAPCMYYVYALRRILC